MTDLVVGQLDIKPLLKGLKMKCSLNFVTGAAGAALWGFLFVLGGILGFVPGITRDEMFLGVFMVNTPHNILHIVSGVFFFIGAISGAKPARLCFLTLGSFYMALSLIGFEVGTGLIFHLISNTPIDSWGHGFLGLALLLSGIASPKQSRHAYACCGMHKICGDQPSETESRP